MADKAISELNPVERINLQDNFVLEQNYTAMRLTGQVLLNCLATELDAHGGIRTIEKTDTQGLVDTYTITFSDESTWDFTVTNGRSITDLSLQGTQVLVDTYRITYNDGTHFDFDVTNGNGITDIRKVGTDVLVDTYRMFYGNGGTFDVPVTNGKGIVSIAKTATQVLVDTYTIAYNDNTTETFDVHNGRGIVNIAKTSTDVLADTYTVNYNDGGTDTIVVTNGRSIVNIAKTSTDDLKDTYTITYNDNTTSTFIVTNGDSTHVYFKYSTEQPVRDSDMHDTCDNWMGVYAGYEKTAPSQYTAYSWFEIKGEKGNPGDNAYVTGTLTEYATGHNDYDVPTTWSTTLPSVAPGDFLWMRVTISFSTGGQAEFLACVRSGMDGTGGTVRSVNGVVSQSDGNVDLIRVEGKTLVINRVGS